MGIQGLLTLVKDASEPCNIKKYAGYTVAVDTYCWIHKGAFGCASQLAKGEPTDQYVRYVLKYVNMLLSMKIKPILVFDGCNLPSKQIVEKSRRERRETYLVKGKQFLREGKVSEARDCFTKCINVTSKMALEVMKAARSLGVDCIVAPYEADAQLAYLNKIGIAQCVITEDSDLIAFGCSKVVVKMDLNGNGLEIDNSKLNKIMKMGGNYSFEKFRYMCIASGCDYLPSLPNIGLKKACKVFKMATNPDITQVLKRMGQYLKSHLVVPDEYIQGFIQANNTFLYQLAFDPMKKKVVPLSPYPADLGPNDMPYAGQYLKDKLALQLSLGNIDVQSMTVMNNFKPNTHKPIDKKTASHLISIWHDNYRPRGKQLISEVNKEERLSTKGKEVSVKTAPWKPVKKLPSIPKDIGFREDIETNEQELQSQYSDFKDVKKKSPTKTSSTPSTKKEHSPHRKRLNRFALNRMSAERRETLLKDNSTETSRFFAGSSNKSKNTEPQSPMSTEDGLYEAMEAMETAYTSSLTLVEEETDGEKDDSENKDITETKSVPESKHITETKSVQNLRNKFCYSKQSSTESATDERSTENKIKDNPDDGIEQISSDDFEILSETSKQNEGFTEKQDKKSCENTNSSPSVKSNYFQNLNHFRWNRKGVKTIQRSQSAPFLDSPKNSSKLTLINSGDINGQFKRVKKSADTVVKDIDVLVVKDTEVSVVKDIDVLVVGDDIDGASQKNNSLCEQDSSDSMSNLLTSQDCLSSGVLSSQRGVDISLSSHSQDLDDKTHQTRNGAESADEKLPCSQGDITSSQRSLTGTRCSGLSNSQPSSRKTSTGSKKLLQSCKVSGLSKSLARKRKSMDENLLQSKQRKLTDMFTPKSMLQKSKSKGIPMSPIKDNEINLPTDTKHIRHLNL